MGRRRQASPVCAHAALHRKGWGSAAPRPEVAAPGAACAPRFEEAGKRARRCPSSSEQRGGSCPQAQCSAAIRSGAAGRVAAWYPHGSAQRRAGTSKQQASPTGRKRKRGFPGATLDLPQRSKNNGRAGGNKKRAPAGAAPTAQPSKVFRRCVCVCVCVCVCCGSRQKKYVGSDRQSRAHKENDSSRGQGPT